MPGVREKSPDPFSFRAITVSSRPSSQAQRSRRRVLEFSAAGVRLHYPSCCGPELHWNRETPPVPFCFPGTTDPLPQRSHPFDDLCGCGGLEIAPSANGVVVGTIGPPPFSFPGSFIATVLPGHTDPRTPNRFDLPNPSRFLGNARRPATPASLSLRASRRIACVTLLWPERSRV